MDSFGTTTAHLVGGVINRVCQDIHDGTPGSVHQAYTSTPEQKLWSNLKKKYCPRPKNQEEVKLAILEAFFAVKIHDFQYYHEYISFNDPTMIYI